MGFHTDSLALMCEATAVTCLSGQRQNCLMVVNEVLMIRRDRQRKQLLLIENGSILHKEKENHKNVKFPRSAISFLWPIAENLMFSQ